MGRSAPIRDAATRYPATKRLLALVALSAVTITTGLVFLGNGLNTFYWILIYFLFAVVTLRAITYLGASISPVATALTWVATGLFATTLPCVFSGILLRGALNLSSWLTGRTPTHEAGAHPHDRIPADCVRYRSRSEYLNGQLALEARASLIYYIASDLSNVFMTERSFDVFVRDEIVKRHPREYEAVAAAMAARIANIKTRLDEIEIVVVFSMDKLRDEIISKGELARQRVVAFLDMMDSHPSHLRACHVTQDDINNMVEVGGCAVIFDEKGQVAIAHGRQIRDSQDVSLVQNQICGPQAEESIEANRRAQQLIKNCDFKATTAALRKVVSDLRPTDLQSRR